MHSRKSTSGRGYNVSTPIYRNFRISVEDTKFYTSSQKRLLVKVNNKRARRLNYNLVMGFEE